MDPNSVSKMVFSITMITLALFLVFSLVLHYLIKFLIPGWFMWLLTLIVILIAAGSVWNAIR
jgi:hypothetical protein